MCDATQEQGRVGQRTLPVAEAVGTVLAHDITEIRPGEFKGRAFPKGHIIREEDVCHLQLLGKEHLFVLDIGADEMHEDEAAYELAHALMGRGVGIREAPRRQNRAHRRIRRPPQDKQRSSPCVQYARRGHSCNAA